MGLNQGKNFSKIGHMQDTGMVNPKDRNSRMRGLANQREYPRQPLGLQNAGNNAANYVPPGSRTPLERQNIDFGAQIKSKSDVRLDQKPR